MIKIKTKFFIINNQDILQRNQILLKDLENIQNSTSSKRYNWNDYSSIVIDPIEKDICSVMLNATQIIENAKVESVLQLDQCNELYDGLMKTGILITLKTIFSRFQEFVNITQFDNTQEFKKYLNSWDQGANLSELDALFDQVIEVFHIIVLFQIYNGQKFYEYLQELQLSLFFFHLSVMILVFCFGMSYFCKFLAKSINRYKHLISIINIDSIVDNPYIVSFYRKQQNLKEL